MNTDKVLPQGREEAVKKFRVYTFCDPRPHGLPLRRKDVTAYTLWASEDWKGCEVYEIEADSGAAAKSVARQRRFDKELLEREGRKQ